MGLLNLFRKENIIIKLTLSNSSGNLVVSENIKDFSVPISRENILTLIFLGIIPQSFFLVDSPGVRLFLVDFLKNLQKEDYKKYIDNNRLPKIHDYEISVYKFDNEDYPRIKLQAPSLLGIGGIKNEIDFATLMLFLMIFLYENIQDKTIIRFFLEELLSGISAMPILAVGAFNHIMPISTKYFDKMNLKLP